MFAMKYGTEDLIGAPKHFLVQLASLSLRMPKFTLVAKLKYIYKFFRLGSCLKPNFGTGSVLPIFALQKYIENPLDQILRPSGPFLLSFY